LHRRGGGSRAATARRLHPTQKNPKALLARGDFSPPRGPDDLVLDPFSGNRQRQAAGGPSASGRRLRSAVERDGGLCGGG